MATQSDVPPDSTVGTAFELAENPDITVPKLVMRRVPAGISESAFWASLKEFSDPSVLVYRYFSKGRVSRKHISKQPRPSCAYLVFADNKTTVKFIETFSYHVYVDGSGNPYVSSLSKAFFQLMPSRDQAGFRARLLNRSRSGSRPHSPSYVKSARCTLDKDADFIAFSSSLTCALPKTSLTLESSGAALNDISNTDLIFETGSKLENDSLDLKADAKTLYENVLKRSTKTTPLIEHLRRLRSNRTSFISSESVNKDSLRPKSEKRFANASENQKMILDQDSLLQKLEDSNFYKRSPGKFSIEILDIGKKKSDRAKNDNQSQNTHRRKNRGSRNGTINNEKDFSENLVKLEHKEKASSNNLTSPQKMSFFSETSNLPHRRRRGNGTNSKSFESQHSDQKQQHGGNRQLNKSDYHIGVDPLKRPPRFDKETGMNDVKLFENRYENSSQTQKETSGRRRFGISSRKYEKEICETQKEKQIRLRNENGLSSLKTEVPSKSLTAATAAAGAQMNCDKNTQSRKSKFIEDPRAYFS